MKLLLLNSLLFITRLIELTVDNQCLFNVSQHVPLAHPLYFLWLALPPEVDERHIGDTSVALARNFITWVNLKTMEILFERDK